MIFAHYGVDGKACAVLARKFFEKTGKYSICDYDNIEEQVNQYLDKIESNSFKDEFLLIADISITAKTAKRIEGMKENFKYLHMVSHEPKKHKYLNSLSYNWTYLFEDRISSTKILEQMISIYYEKDTSDYEDFVNAVNDHETWNDNEQSKIVNDLSHNLKTHDFINRFRNNPSLKLSSKEELILGIREDDIQSTLDNCHVTTVGATCYVFTDRFINDISDRIFDDNQEVEVIVAINFATRSVSYRSRNDDIDVSEIARRNGGNGKKGISGSKMSEDIIPEIIDLVLKDGFIDYSKERV
jgi:uncharacterized protein